MHYYVFDCFADVQDEQVPRRMLGMKETTEKGQKMRQTMLKVSCHKMIHKEQEA